MSTPRRKGGHMRAGGSFWLLIALACIVSPMEVVAAVLSAAALHELGHLAALRHYGVTVRSFRLTAFGAELDAPKLALLSYGRELVVTLAGVAVNLLSTCFLAALGLWFRWEWPFIFAGAHLLLAAFNLLPILPLDGARALRLITAYFFGPIVADTVCASISVAGALALCALGLRLSLRLHSGALFVFAAFGLLWRTLRQLGLANGGKKV